MLLVPRWIQLVSLPVILLFGWIFAGAVRHALFVFLVSGIVAMLLNPLVAATEADMHAAVTAITSRSSEETRKPRNAIESFGSVDGNVRSCGP